MNFKKLAEQIRNSKIEYYEIMTKLNINIEELLILSSIQGLGCRSAHEINEFWSKGMTNNAFNSKKVLISTAIKSLKEKKFISVSKDKNDGRIKLLKSNIDLNKYSSKIKF